MQQNPIAECNEIEKASSEELHAKLAIPELCAEGDPSTKYEKESNSGTKKKGRGRPPKHGLSGTRTYRSFHEAKQRCKNIKCPDYPQYGGRGIEFRLQSVKELVADIGLRPADKTLDRKDFNGHYEAGNVRWADAKEQANNRRPPSRYSNNWHRGQEIRKDYLEAARHWLLSIKAMNNHTDLSPEEVAYLEERHVETSLPRATFWDVDTGPHYVALPSLNWPGKTILRVNPWLRIRDERGLLSGTEDIPLRANCSEEELGIINDFVNNIRSYRTGLIYSSCYHFTDNRIEGRLLATAGRLAGSGLKARVVLAAELAELLSVNDSDRLGEGGYLILPDLNVWSSAFGADYRLNNRLRDVLEEREFRRLPTIVYFEGASEHQLGSVFGRYMQANMANIIPPGHHVPWAKA